MCRIAGIIKNNSSFLTHIVQAESSIRRMTGSMAHGGPDDEGIYINSESTVYLGHRRLSLLDLSPAGHQPMCAADGTLIITFNGEIYNYRELRHELIGKGYQFRTHTDTEVILYAFREWGEGAFSRLNGMFAFSLYDTTSGQIYLVRDPSGIKPLYYTIREQGLVFASEIKAFLRSGLIFEEQPNWKIYFLSFGFIPEPYSSLQHVFMLPKGHFLKWEVNTGKSQIKSYFRFTFTSAITNQTEAIHLIKQKLEASVVRHLISDAPIGVFLSGGVDSSLLALLAKQEMQAKLHTLSIIFDEEFYSERKFQEIIVNKLQGKHSYYKVTAEDFRNSLPNILEAMDQPSMDGINTYFISRCAREEGLKAVLSGLGADELLGGYPSFKRSATFNYTRYLPSFSYQFGKYFSNDKLKKTSFLSMDGDIGKFLFLRGLFNPEAVASILQLTEREVLLCLQKLNTTNRYEELGPGNFTSWIETNFYMQSLLLKDSDVMSMWHGIEIRVPFLDKEFIETVFQILPELKFEHTQAKWLLISAFKDILPQEIWKRPKQGFEFPFKKWMKKSDFSTQMLQSPNKAVRKLASDFQQDKLQWPRLWAVALTERWSQQELTVQQVK